MSLRPRRDDPKLLPALVEQWGRLVACVDELADDRFESPSPLAGWSVAELVAHVSRSLAAVAVAAAGPTADRTGLTVSGYLTGTSARAEAIAAAGRADAAGLAPAAVRVLLRDTVNEASAASGAADLDRTVVTPGGPMRLGDFLVTRVVEAVVHGLDLGVTPGRDALRIAVRAFVDTMAAVAPGHAVELRVPPFAAAQVVAGPRHTRGTPTNVVEAEPVAFVEVAAGRLAWGEAVADGRIRASGERSDLGGYFPLL